MLSFDFSKDLRVLNIIAGTCRIEVFDPRFIYGNCKRAANNNSVLLQGWSRF